MNLPNKLTVLRIILTPVFMLTLLWPFPHHLIAALLIFVFASVTDAVDGNYARKHGLVTDFGKFLDPLADKMLTTAAFLGFIQLGIGTGVVWIAFIVLFREFLISSLRLTAVSSGGAVIAANKWGKAKTISQMVAIITALVAEYFKYLDIEYFHFFGEFLGGGIIIALDVLVDVCLWISAVLTIVSCVIVLVVNNKFVDTGK